MMNTLAPRRASAKAEKLAQRLSGILAILHQGGSVNKHELAQKFQVDVRTIERDLADRLQGIAERGPEGQWQLKPERRSSIPTEYLHQYARLAGTERLFPDTSLHYLLGQLVTPEPSRATHVQLAPQEDLRNQGPYFALLQAAIEQRKECRFTYKNKPRHAQPYRLIHRNGVWYLAAVESDLLKNFSVALVQALEVDNASSFIPDPAHNKYINSKDDVWFTAKTTEVLLRVAPEVAHYFARRPLLPQQQHRADADGSLLVTTHISHPQQLLPVIRYWLPHVRIIKPLEWHEVLVEELRQALAQWEV